MKLNYKQYSFALEPISEDVMINTFLNAELKSKRFGERIAKSLNARNLTNELILKPNFNDELENAHRKEVLEEARKYKSRRDLFEGFPNDVKWYKVLVTPDFLLNEVKYIDYDYWVELSNGSRLAKDAVEKISKDERVYKVPYDSFKEASEVFKQSKSFDSIIVVSDQLKFVVLEGHLRLTVYAMNKDILPNEITILLGISEKMNNWTSF
jgi:hypothetical protein